MPPRFPVGAVALSFFFAAASTAQAEGSEDGPVRLSVEGRLRYEVIDPAAFGFGPQDPGGYVLWRIAPQIDVDMSPGLTARVQLFAANVADREGGARANDRNDLDLTQAFVQWSPSEGSFVRAGRQEIALGSGRLLASLDGANIRRRFDGVHAQWKLGDWTAVGLAASPVLVEPGSFDDDSSTGRLATGGGVIHGDPGRRSEAVYYLRTEGRDRGFGSPGGPQVRHTAGVRVVRNADRAFGELELLRQWGDAATGEEIDAWAVAGEARVNTVEVGGADLVVSARFSLASGDDDPADAKLGGFDPLFTNPGFTGSFPIFAPTNLSAVTPAVTFQWKTGDRVGLDVTFLERLEEDDRTYALSGAALPAPASGRDVGALWAITGARRLSPNVSINATAFWFDQSDRFAPGVDDARGGFVNLNFSY